MKNCLFTLIRVKVYSGILNRLPTTLLAAFGRKRAFLQNHWGQQQKAPKLPFPAQYALTFLFNNVFLFYTDWQDKEQIVGIVESIAH